MKHCKEVEVCQYSDTENNGQANCSKEDVCKYFLKSDSLTIAVEALSRLSKAVRTYADIGRKQFNDDEKEFYEMCDENDKAEQSLDRLAEEEK